MLAVSRSGSRTKLRDTREEVQSRILALHGSAVKRRRFRSDERVRFAPPQTKQLT